MVEATQMNLFMADNLANVISGLGTYKDKSVSTQYVFVPLSIGQLEAAYRGDWIARKIVDIPAHDSTRMWREWKAEKEEITKIEDLERDLDIQGKVNRAMILGRLYGGAALVIGVDGAGAENQELDVERVKQDSLRSVTVVHRYELGGNDIDWDLNSKNYRFPKFYQIKSGEGQMLDVHWSRVIRFTGSPIPDPNQAPDGWGDSVLQVVDTAIKGAGMVIGGIAALVNEAKIDVIKIPNLSERLSTKEYADKLALRMSYANVIKSMNNALLIDAAEEWQRITTSFASLPDILQNYLMCAAGAADIPATRLIGQSPKGLNATGESDVRNYYDKIKSEQNTILRPALSTLDEVLIRSALGSRDEEIFYEWNSLWQMTENEAADLAKKKADTLQIDVNTGLIDQNALRIGRENQLIEDGTYPGLDQTLQDQEAGEIPTEEVEFAGDPEMNPDHPQNVAASEMAQAEAKKAQFHAKNPLAEIKAKAQAKKPPAKKKKVGDELPQDEGDPGVEVGDGAVEIPLDPTTAPSPPVIITNVMPPYQDVSHHGLSLEQYDALGVQLSKIITDAISKVILTSPAPVPHGGRVKRVIKDVEHDDEGKITRMIETTEEE